MRLHALGLPPTDHRPLPVVEAREQGRSQARTDDGLQPRRLGDRHREGVLPDGGGVLRRNDHHVHDQLIGPSSDLPGDKGLHAEESPCGGRISRV